jgi:hypothetical protein
MEQKKDIPLLLSMGNILPICAKEEVADTLAKYFFGTQVYTETERNIQKMANGSFGSDRSEDTLGRSTLYSRIIRIFFQILESICRKKKVSQGSYVYTGKGMYYRTL